MLGLWRMTGFECIFDGLVRMTLNSFLFRRGKWREKYPSNGWRNQPTSLYYCSHLGSHLTEKLFIIAAYLIICANIGGVWYLPNFISQIWWCIILRPLKPLCKTLSVLLAFEFWQLTWALYGTILFFISFTMSAYIICLLLSYGKDPTLDWTVKLCSPVDPSIWHLC